MNLRHLTSACRRRHSYTTRCSSVIAPQLKRDSLGSARFLARRIALTLPFSVFSKNQVDRLGDRLRRGAIEDADLKLLDAYRRSFVPGYEKVIATIREVIAYHPTGRPAKSTTSIVEKLKRESIRLTQMQDIAGCRLVVRRIGTQNTVVRRLK